MTLRLRDCFAATTSAKAQLSADGAKRWPAPAADGLDAYWLREGDVILAMDRPWIEAGLKYAYVRQPDLPALLVQRVARLRGSDRLDTGFLRYVIAGRGFTDYVTGIQTGTAVPHISGGQIRGLPIPAAASGRAAAHRGHPRRPRRQDRAEPPHEPDPRVDGPRPLQILVRRLRPRPSQSRRPRHWSTPAYRGSIPVIASRFGTRRSPLWMGDPVAR